MENFTKKLALFKFLLELSWGPPSFLSGSFYFFGIEKGKDM